MAAKSVLVWEPFARRFRGRLVERKFQDIKAFQSFSDFSVICPDRSAWPKTWQSYGLLTAGCDILHRHKRIYLSSWPWLATVTMPDDRVITTFTLVKFLLSFPAFIKVSVSVYTRKMFTKVSKLPYLSKPFKSKHSISLESISRLLCSVSSAFMDTPPII